MYSVSPAFKAAVRGPHDITVRAEIWRGGIFLRSLEVLSGAVDIDSRRSQRRTCRVTVPASRPTVRLEPVFNTYQSIRGVVVSWDTVTATWDGAGTVTWEDGNQLPSSDEPGPYPTYADLAAAFPNYAALQSITGYTEIDVDDGLIPDSAFSDVTPFGNELRLWRGIMVEQPLFYTYQNIKGIRTTWDLVSASLTWATIDSLLTWADGNDVPI